MANYIIGDIHGCYGALMALLEKIEFNPKQDHLYLVGDLINRGPDSLSTMKFILNHPTAIHAILGNHDLSFLAYANNSNHFSPNPTFDALIDSDQGEAIIHYFRQLPLLRTLDQYHLLIAHAGIPPQWCEDEARQYSREVEAVLQGDTHAYAHFMDHLFGNLPDQWDAQLEGIDRLRAIVNYFTRMRLLYPDGRLDFEIKSALSGSNQRQPWFTFPHKIEDKTILFGHWAALGIHHENGALCLDSGAVWGNQLTALALDHATDDNPWPLISVPATRE